MPRRARSTRYLPLVVAWQLVLVAVLVLALQRAVWAVALAGVILLAALLLSLPVNGRTLFSTLRIHREFRRRAATRVEAAEHAPDLVPLAQWLPLLELTQIRDAHDEEIGVLADGSSWVGLLEVKADTSLFTDRGAKLDLSSLSALIRQDDVVFAGIQVVTYTVPAPSSAMLPPGSPALQAYRELAGDQTPPAVRRTWVALRLDPRLCLEAVGRRGSGQVGVFATLRFGLHRAQALLKRHGMVTEPLDPIGIAEVMGLTTGAPAVPAPTQERWESWVCDSLVHQTRAIRGFGGSPSAGYQELLDIINQAPVMFAVTSLTVGPGEPPRGGVRLVSADTTLAEAADEFVAGRLHDRLRFGPRGGVQVPGVLATAPLGRQVEQ